MEVVWGGGASIFGLWEREAQVFEEEEGRRWEKEKRKGRKRKGKKNKKEYSSFYFGIFLFIFIILTLNSPIGLPQFDF